MCVQCFIYIFFLSDKNCLASHKARFQREVKRSSIIQTKADFIFQKIGIWILIIETFNIQDSI